MTDSNLPENSYAHSIDTLHSGGYERQGSHNPIIDGINPLWINDNYEECDKKFDYLIKQNRNI